jgi:hypothetical protein
LGMLQLGDEGFNHLGRAMGFDQDLGPAVLDPASHAVFAGQSPDEGAEPDTLYGSANMNASRFHGSAYAVERETHVLVREYHKV